MKAEILLAKLNELRKDADDDMEYLALHHAFCFLSYRMTEFQTYLDETAQEKG
jgi:hypothetical protein